MTSTILGRGADDASSLGDPSSQTVVAREQQPEQSTRVYYFDYLRVFATLGVVLIHSATQVFNVTRDEGTSALGHYTIANASEALGRFAVGCFFMVSGALLLDSRHRFRLGRQLARVAVPLLFWSCLYLAVDTWWSHRGLPTTGSAGGAQSVTHVLDSLAASTIGNHFWFVYALIACYLALPLLRPITALTDTRQKHLIEYALAIWAVVFLVIPTINHYAPGAIAPYSALLPALPSQFLGFVILGYYLHRYGVQIRGWSPGRPALVAGAVIGFIGIVATTLWDQISGSRSGWGQTNTTLQVVLFGACVFLLAKNLFNRPGKHFAFVSLFSKLSFRIYLVHMLILFWLRSISPLKNLYTVQPEVSIVVLGSITIAVSFGIAYGIEKIKPIRKYI